MTSWKRRIVPDVGILFGIQCRGPSLKVHTHYQQNQAQAGYIIFVHIHA